MRTTAALLLAASLATADVVKEAEPNDDPKQRGLQEIAPGQVLEGTFATAKDQDHFVLVSDKPQVVTMRITHDKKVRVGKFHIRRVTMLPRSTPPNTSGFQLRRLRVPKGRFPLELSSWFRNEAGPYRLEMVVEPDGPGLETEPNDRSANRHELAPGQGVTAEKSHPFGDVDVLTLNVKERGIYRLTLKRADVSQLAPTPRHKGRIECSLVLNTTAEPYLYEVDDIDDEFRFFPVLDPGRHLLTVKVRGGVVGARYDLRFERFDVVVSKETEAAARQAIDRGLAALLETAPSKRRLRYEVAAAATGLLALGEGSGLADREEERARKVDELVTALEQQLRPAPDGEWDGKPVLQFSAELYNHAFAVLALAETAAAGSEHARDVCAKGIPFLLASQISTRRCEAWGTAKSNSAQLGGWRYNAKAQDGDLSVTGWCLIALYAAANADIDVPGLVEAADLSLRFLRQCSGLNGYKYQPQVGGSSTSVRQSIGALLALMFGQPSKALSNAIDDLDLHLCAGTQVGHGDNSPFYYWYYATRVNYLRGGYEWEAWRAVALEQLLRRQQENGTWAAIRHAKHGGERYSTGMAILILRLCIGEPPLYLSRDVEGW